jgi:hypothetical protein
MALPWLRIIDGVLGVSDVVRRARGRSAQAVEEQDQLAAGARGFGAIEARLAGVVVAALKEAFERDHQRLELERQQIEAERSRAEKALRLELLRQTGDRELGRLRLLAGVAVASWLGTLVFATRLVGGPAGARVALGVGWLLLLGALGAAFAAQGAVGRALAGMDERTVAADLTRSGSGAAAPWLIVSGLAVIALGILLT